MPVVMKELPCCVCGSFQSVQLYEDELNGRIPPVDYCFTPETRKTYRIVKCNECGHIFANPMPFFDNVYEESSNDAYQKYKNQRMMTFSKLLEIVLRYKSSGSVLDIGCATGLLLDVFGARFSTHGVELSGWSRDHCDKKHDVRPSVQEFGDKRFDVVTLLGVIEHLEHPDELISMISGIMNKDSLLLVYTGDVEALLPRLLGKKWWWYQGMHVHYFSKRTLEMLLGRYRFEVVGCMKMPLYFSMESLLNSMSRYALMRGLFSRVLKLPSIKNITVPMPLSGEMLLVCKRK